ncbi:SPOR domain-containing protein [Sphingomonas sp.]|uniref:SPOR domain-containing protein n=1 Tax=Sphingomonas sp. TaxID=28214 RepID=UPI0025D005BF|nr:SPOR domain-containing protein [Sphingomonas sp.]
MKLGFGAAVVALAGLLAAGGAMAQSKQSVKDGVDAYQRGEFRRAVDIWRPFAIKGDADAQFNLGQAYNFGRGVPVDLGLAEQWYGRAAAQGHEAATLNYGLILLRNGKRDEAVPWLEKAASRGQPIAQLQLGTMLFNGDSVPKDWVRAYALVTRAEAAKAPKASETRAQMDQYIPADVRQRGLALAKQYETQAGTPALAAAPVEAAPGDTAPTIQATDLPPSRPALAATPAAPPAHAKPAPRQAAAAPGGAWRVQFGAFQDEGNARRLWQSLQPRVGGLAGLQPFLVKAGGFTRLQAGPLASPAAAQRLCAEVRGKQPGQACVPLKP